MFASKKANARRQENDHLVSPFCIEHLGVGDYFGFTIDGNERFVLGNYIVTHNTRLAYGLAKVLDLPIKTINLGSVNDVSYFTNGTGNWSKNGIYFGFNMYRVFN